MRNSMSRALQLIYILGGCKPRAWEQSCLGTLQLHCLGWPNLCFEVGSVEESARGLFKSEDPCCPLTNVSCQPVSPSKIHRWCRLINRSKKHQHEASRIIASSHPEIPLRDFSHSFNQQIPSPSPSHPNPVPLSDWLMIGCDYNTQYIPVESARWGISTLHGPWPGKSMGKSTLHQPPFCRPGPQLADLWAAEGPRPRALRAARRQGRCPAWAGAGAGAAAADESPGLGAHVADGERLEDPWFLMVSG